MSGPAEVEAWLTLRGHGAAAAGACRALRNVRVPEREWIGELIGMEGDGSLGAFLGGIEEKSVAHSPPSGLPPVVVPPSGRGSASSRGARSMAAVTLRASYCGRCLLKRKSSHDTSNQNPTARQLGTASCAATSASKNERRCHVVVTEAQYSRKTRRW